MNHQSPRLKIGYVVKMFPRLSETFVLNEIIELEQQGAEVVVFSLKKPNEGRFHQQVSRLKATVFYLEDLDPKKWQSWISPEWPLLDRHRERLFKLVGDALRDGDSSRVDQIWSSAWIAAKAEVLGLHRLHAHFASLPSTIAHFVHEITGIPYSFTAHAKDIFVYTMDDHLLREKLNTASFVVTVTHFNHRYLTERAPEVDPSRIRVIHNGIGLDQFTPVSPSERDENLILGVGRLVPKKGFSTLLDACALLKSRNVSFRCVIVGDGPELASLTQRSKELGLEDDVTFSGALVIDEVKVLMQRATLFCLPCTVTEDNNADALPTVLLEAMACGLPSISTTVSGVPEIIDSGQDGILVGPDDPVALADQLAKLLVSRDLRAKYAVAGRKKAEEKFDIRRNVGTLLRNYIDDSARRGDFGKTVALSGAPR